MGLTLHPMKEIRVIVSGEHQAFVTDLLDRIKATGYTIIGNVSGKGHHGVHEAHFMFSEQESLEMIMTVKEHEMHHRGQLMLIERIIGIVPHLTRQMQERVAQRQQSAQR